MRPGPPASHSSRSARKSYQVISRNVIRTLWEYKAALNEYSIKEEGIALFLRESRRAVRLQVHTRCRSGGIFTRAGGDIGRQAWHSFLPMPAVATRPHTRYADCLSLHSFPPEPFRHYQALLVRAVRAQGCPRPFQVAPIVAEGGRS